MTELSQLKAPVPIDDISLSGVRIYIIGPLRVLDPQGNNIEIQSRKARAILGYLSLRPGERVMRSRLAGLLWDRSQEIQAKASLRQAIYELNAIFENCAPDLLRIDREAVCLRSEHCWIDAVALIHSTERRDETYDFLAPPIDRLLEDFVGLTVSFDQFLQSERTRLQNQVTKTLEDQLERTIARDGHGAECATVARKLITVEGSHEGAVRALMKSFVNLGDRAQAIREFERFKRTLRLLLDVDPSKETYALYEAVRAVPTRDRSGPLRMAATETVDAPPAIAPSVRAPPAQCVSIAVLPFHTAEQTHSNLQIIEGIADEIIGCLSRITGFFVISRLSTLSFSDRLRNPQEIGAALGVRYIVSGSAGFTAEKARFAVELTDSYTGQVLFTSKFNESTNDIFELQDRISFNIVGQIAPYLRELELKRIRSKRPENLGAYDYLLRGIERMHNNSPEIFQLAGENFSAAIKLDQHYAAAYAWLGYWHALRVGQGWSIDPKEDAARSDQFVQMAVDYDSTDSFSLALYGHLTAYLHKDFSLGFERLNRALEFNPNSAPAWLWTGAAHAWMGDGKPAIEKVERAMSLSPYDPVMYAYTGIAGMAYLMDGQHERAIEFALRCIQQNRTYTHAYRLLTMALSLAGKAEEASIAAQRLLQFEPNLTVERFRSRYPGSAYPNCQALCRALRQSGVPTK